MKIIKQFACWVFAIACVATPASADEPMTFFMESDQQSRLAAALLRGGVEDIYASGEITEGTKDRFLAFVRSRQVEAAKIHFNSPGGSLAEGIELGRAIRSLGFFTSVGVYTPSYDPDADSASICASACAYAYAGGTSRFLSQYTGKLGIHQFYSAPGSATSNEEVQQISGLIVAYLDQMGVDAKAFSISTIANPDGMIWLSPDDALGLKFANNGSDAPEAEIKLAGMVPYLHIQQDHHDVTTRVLFLCYERELSMMFGMVTDPTSSAMFAENQKRSYLELDGEEFLAIPGNTGAKASDSVVWIERQVSEADLFRIVTSTEMAGWIDGFGAVRYGASLQLPTVRAKISDFAEQCSIS